jgi:hypothetical protein
VPTQGLSIRNAWSRTLPCARRIISVCAAPIKRPGFNLSRLRGLQVAGGAVVRRRVARLHRTLPKTLHFRLKPTPTTVIWPPSSPRGQRCPSSSGGHPGPNSAVRLPGSAARVAIGLPRRAGEREGVYSLSLKSRETDAGCQNLTDDSVVLKWRLRHSEPRNTDPCTLFMTLRYGFKRCRGRFKRADDGRRAI